MNRNVAYFTILFFTSLIVAGCVYAAVTISIRNTPSVIEQSQEFSAEVSFSCSSCDDSYLRGVLYHPDSTTNYFGYTQNNSGSWINSTGSSCTQYFKLAAGDLVEGSWSGQLRFKPDPSDTAYKGSGNYYFKVLRYTPSCGTSDPSESVAVVITGPTQTPVPSNTLAPSKTPTLTRTPTTQPANTQIPTRTHTPVTGASRSPTRTPTRSGSPSPTTTLKEEPTEIPVSVVDTTYEGVLETAEATASGTRSSRPVIITLLFVSTGLALLAGVFAWKKYEEKKSKE